MSFISTLLLLVLMLTPLCYGFEAKKHGVFSNDAAALYEVCTGRHMPRELLSFFVEGAIDEDKPSLTRATNWHFYNNEKRIGRYWWFVLRCNGSNEHIFKIRLDALKSMLDSKKPNSEIYEAAGRVAHHIQDMSSPSHVMPIYHAGNDKFDKYVPAPVTASNVSQRCDEISGTPADPFTLLEEAAKDTLRVVREGRTVENETWMKFWDGPDDEKRPGFKTYGEYGNVFGIIPPCEGNMCQAYTRSMFDTFYTQRYMRAVIDTARLFRYLDEQNKGSQQSVLENSVSSKKQMK